MIRLNLTTEPRWIALLPGLMIRVAPITTSIMAAARSDVSLDTLDADAPKEVLAVAMAQAMAQAMAHANDVSMAHAWLSNTAPLGRRPRRRQ